MSRPNRQVSSNSSCASQNKVSKLTTHDTLCCKGCAVQTPTNQVVHAGLLYQLQVPLNEYEFPTNKLASVQAQLERLVEKNYYLHQSARDAYRSYILAYNSHALKDIFNVHTLDLQVSTGFPDS